MGARLGDSAGKASGLLYVESLEGSIFDRFRRKPVITSSPPPASDIDSALRKEVSALYDRCVNPIHAVKAMRYEKNGSLTADAKKLSDIWLGTANDLLDRGKIEFYSRNQLVVIRDILGNAIADTGPVQKTFVTKYRENTRRINEMKFLQSYQPKLVDAAGVMQFEAVRNMLAEIEHETANNPGSLAPDISTETLARLYSLRDNWDNPARLS